MNALWIREGASHGEFALAGQRAPDGSRKKIAMVIGIIVLVLLAVRVYLSQQGPYFASLAHLAG